MDDWEQDPAVQAMRRIFKEMEKTKNAILARLNIAAADPRIRGWMESALALFERSWAIANQMSVSMDAKRASLIYAHCLSSVIASEGVEIPDGLIPEDKEMEGLVNEVFR